MNTNERILKIKNWVLNYSRNMPSKPHCLVIGVSGGVDSAVTSTICALTGIKTIVLSIPIKQIKSQDDLSKIHCNWLKKFKPKPQINYELINQSYRDRINDIISGDVHHIRHREIILMDESDNELILPRDEQIPSDFFRKGDTVRAVIKEVQFNKGKPRIIISRTSPVFLERLFELEIPEIADGLIVIKNVKL